MSAAGRCLQFAGLLIPPFAIASELMGQVGLGRSMLIALVGAGLFFLGMGLQRSAEG